MIVRIFSPRCIFGKSLIDLSQGNSLLNQFTKRIITASVELNKLWKISMGSRSSIAGPNKLLLTHHGTPAQANMPINGHFPQNHQIPPVRTASQVAYSVFLTPAASIR